MNITNSTTVIAEINEINNYLVKRNDFNGIVKYPFWLKFLDALA